MVKKAKRSDETLPFIPRTSSRPNPMSAQPQEGIPEYSGVYRHNGRLYPFDTSFPEHRSVVIETMRKIKKFMEKYPDYLDFLEKELSGRIVSIQEGSRLQRLAICTAIWALENEKDWALKQMELGQGELRDFGKGAGSAPILTWEDAYRLIMNSGIANPHIELRLGQIGVDNVHLVATGLDMFSVMPAPGIDEGRIRAFFESRLRGTDFSRPANMYGAAVEAQKAGLITIKYRYTRDLPNIKVNGDV